jgi:hypothetical protein
VDVGSRLPGCFFSEFKLGCHALATSGNFTKTEFVTDSFLFRQQGQSGQEGALAIATAATAATASLALLLPLLDVRVVATNVSSVSFNLFLIVSDQTWSGPLLHFHISGSNEELEMEREFLVLLGA